MTTQQVADRLVDMCRQGQFASAYDELFAADAVAYEMEGAPDRITRGLDALKAKNEAFSDNIVEMHEFSVTDPVVQGDHFSCGMMLDMTSKDRGRQRMDEICVYHVKGGKIASERFIYDMGE